MLKKKLFMLSAIASLLVVGTGVAVASTNDGFNKNLDVNATNNLTLKWNGSDSSVATSGGNTVKFKVEGVIFENVDPIQRIKSFDLSGTSAGGIIQYQAGYYSDGANSKIFYTDYAECGLDKITFKAGQEPSFLRFKNWKPGNATIIYDCVDGDKTQFNKYPLETGWYLTGDKDFVVSERGPEWSILGAKKMTRQADGSYIYALNEWGKETANKWVFKPIYYDASTNKINWEKFVYEEKPGDAFLNHSAYWYKGNVMTLTNSYYKVVITPDEKLHIETRAKINCDKILKLVGDELGWEYNNSENIFYKNPSSSVINSMIIQNIALTQGKNIEVKFGDGENKFGLQQVPETGNYDVVISLNTQDLKQSEVTLKKV